MPHWERDPRPRLLELAQQERLGLLRVGRLLTTAGDCAEHVMDVPEPMRKLWELDQLHEGTPPQTLFHQLLAAEAIPEPSVDESTVALALERAQSLVRGCVGVRETAWSIVEISGQGRELGASAAALSIFAEIDRLLVVRDEADEIVRSATGERRTRFESIRAEHDAEILTEARGLLARFGVNETTPLEGIQAAARNG